MRLSETDILELDGRGVSMEVFDHTPTLGELTNAFPFMELQSIHYLGEYYENENSQFFIENSAGGCFEVSDVEFFDGCQVYGRGGY